MEKDIKDLKVLIDNKTLIDRIKTLADEINSNYDIQITLDVFCKISHNILSG